MSNDTTSRHAYLLSIWRYAVSFIVGVIVAAFTVGTARQRIKEVAIWKDHTAPRIERMDSIGSLAFEHWKVSHDKESEHWKAAHDREEARQQEAMKELEQRVRELEKR